MSSLVHQCLAKEEDLERGTVSLIASVSALIKTLTNGPMSSLCQSHLAGPRAANLAVSLSLMAVKSAFHKLHMGRGLALTSVRLRLMIIGR